MIPISDSVPNSSWPVVTWGLIGLNVWVFLYEVTLGPDLEAFIQTWAFIPAQYFLVADTAPESGPRGTCRSSRPCFSTAAGPT